MTTVRTITPADSADAEGLARITGTARGFILSVLRASPDCVMILSPDGRIRFINGTGLALLEAADILQVRGTSWVDLWPGPARAAPETATARALEGHVSEFEAPCPTLRGTERWWHVTVSPVHGPDGRTSWLLATQRDITERVDREVALRASLDRLAAEAEQKAAALRKADLLLREIDHRVRNNFTLISGLLRLQARTLEGPARASVEDAAMRVTAVAKVHERLYSEGSVDEVALHIFLRDLTCDLIGAVGPVSDTTGLALSEVVVPADIAISIGLIASELVSNALKYGGGPSALALTRTDSGLTLILDDNGPGLPEAVLAGATTGLGMRICRAYADKLGGTLTPGAAPSGGARFALTVPL